MYIKMLFFMVPMIGQALAWGAYLFYSYGLGHFTTLDAKFEFLHKYELGYVFLCVWIMSLARGRLMINANSMRAGARVDRPDQHVYKIMDASAKSDAPYVLMANTGAVGRFNRAQRGIFNTDEAMPLFLVNTILAGAVFGPLVLVLTALAAAGRVTFGLGYTENPSGRGKGFMMSMIGEQWTAGLVLLIAIKALAGNRIPF